MTAPDSVPPLPVRLDAVLAARGVDADLSGLLPPASVQLAARRRLDPLDLPPAPTTTSVGRALGRTAARACFGAVDAVRRRQYR
ncbi:hypothetical protein GCM10023221_26890 [Luteimicrobium xylanilyticum]|uniref:Uncharacterized protein n=1 Tax=Luteimicrobium xylanilyticum TaxID=1133546 RepID=A0A5P9QH74_9MICO|nr:hypothetical protein [Luteimicrobium xylanilyticum]QFU99815.1 hypothetical protein KDY119_03351 [Luteimicrobium xylanilyticum]